MKPSQSTGTFFGTEKSPTGASKKPNQTSPRVRRYFPETMFWRPEVITDDRGRAELPVQFADSITTWRLAALASSPSGHLGGTAIPLPVFQDFFIEPDVPVALTRNDEVAFPVAIFNYLKTPQKVSIQLRRADWFALIDDRGLTRTLMLKPGEVRGIKFRIRANKVGTHPLHLTVSSRSASPWLRRLRSFLAPSSSPARLRSGKYSDAVRRMVRVEPHGEKVEHVFTDNLGGKQTHLVSLPKQAIEGSGQLHLMLYPGVLGTLLEGLEGMLRMPTGCMEQTFSSLYPNILILNYLHKSGLRKPTVRQRAQRYIGLGYQRLLTFQHNGGGFSLWGRGKPSVWLSAYGLHQLVDLSRVHPERSDAGEGPGARYERRDPSRAEHSES